MGSLKKKVYIRDNRACVWCHKDLLYSEATADHIVPKSKGGTNEASNLQLMCGRCNNRKGDLSMGLFKAKEDPTQVNVTLERLRKKIFGG